MVKQVGIAMTPGAATLFLAALFPACVAVHAQNPPQVGDSCQTTQTLAACQSLAKAGTANPAAGLYVALASSFTMGFAGLAHGQTSQSVAEQTAVTNCNALGANDCKIQKSAQNSCVAMATYYAVFGMGTLINFGYGEGANRAWRCVPGAGGMCQSLRAKL